MRRWLLIMPLAVAGCRNSDAGSACDKDALIELAKALEAAPEADQVDMVWPATLAACGDAIPEGAQFYYGYSIDPESVRGQGSLRLDPRLVTMKQKACPGWDDGVGLAVANAPAAERGAAAFRGCNFARYGILDAREAEGKSSGMVTWAMHQWFLDQGLEAKYANPITRALLAVDQRGDQPIRRLSDQSWPIAAGVPLEPGIAVHVTRERIVFNEQLWASLKDGELTRDAVSGHVIHSLVGALAEEVDTAKRMAAELGNGEWDKALILSADADTPFSTVVDVLYTANGAGFRRYSIVVEPTSYDFSQIPVEITKLDRRPSLYATNGPKAAIPQMARNSVLGDPDRSDMATVMTVEVTPSGFSISQRPKRSADPVEAAPGDYEAIADHARELKQADPRAHQIVISAEPTVHLQELVGAMAAARGPKCEPDGTSCVLPEVIVAAEHAHAYSPQEMDPYGGAFAVGNDDHVLDGKTLRILQPKTRVKGALDSRIIRRIVSAHIAEVRQCYATGLARDPKLEGRVTINFVITGTGKVGAAVVQESTLNDKAVANCIAKAFKRWKFPTARDRGNVIVTYPFELSVD